MPMSTDITLPRAAKPVFPDRCVACGLLGPDSRIRVVTYAIGWWTIVFWVSGRKFWAEVPACKGCRLRMVRQRWLRRFMEWPLILLAVVAAFHFLDGYQGPFKRWLVMGIVLVSLLPWLLWEIAAPPPIDLTASSTTVQYEFRDEEYAAEFLALNS